MAKKPKRANLKPPGRCIFCERIAGIRDPDTGKTVEMSKQHLFPEWMHTPFPKTAPWHLERRIANAPDQGPSWDKRRQGDTKARQLRVVCKSNCNEGWISRLEEDTKGFMLPLMRGEKFSLNADEQRLLALWICEVTIVFEFTDQSNIAVPMVDRRYVYQSREPPNGWSIWIGQNPGEMWQWSRTHYSYTFGAAGSLEPPLDAALRKNFQVSSFQVGQLFAHASSSTVQDVGESERRLDFTPYGLHRIWPLTGKVVEWPSSHILNDEKALFLARRMNHVIERRAASGR